MASTARVLVDKGDGNLEGQPAGDFGVLLLTQSPVSVRPDGPDQPVAAHLSDFAGELDSARSVPGLWTYPGNGNGGAALAPNQTVFPVPGGYTPGFVKVRIGPFYIDAFTDADGASVILTGSYTFGPGDVVEIEVLKAGAIANTASKAVVDAKRDGTVPSSSDLIAGTSTVAVPSVADVPKIGVVRPGPTTPALHNIKSRLNLGSVDLREWADIDFTGSHDNAATFQTACNDAMREGFEIVCRVPGVLALGSKILAASGKPLRLRSTVCPQISPYDATRFATFQDRGSACWLHFAHNGIGIELNRAPNDAYAASSIDHVYGHQILGFGTSRDQGNVAAPGWVPKDSGFDISVRNGGADLDLVTLNTTRFVECYNGDNSKIRLRGQPLLEGLTALYNFHRIEAELDFWPYWSYLSAVRLFTSFNRTALRTARADGLRASIFDFQGQVSHRVQNVAATSGKPQTLPGGTSYDVHVDYLYADSTASAVQVDAGCDGARCTYGNIIAQPPDAGGLESETAFRGRQSSPVLVLSNRAQVSVAQFRSAFAGSSHAYITGNNSNINIGTVTYGSWNRADLSDAPTTFAGFACSAESTGSSVQIGLLKDLFVSPGNPGNVDGMRRPMPVLGKGATVSARADAAGTITSPLA